MQEDNPKTRVGGKAAVSARLKGMFGSNWALLRVVIICVVLLIGVGGMLFFEMMKQAPEEVVPTERALQVEVVGIQPETVPVRLRGYGEVFSLNQVMISPEVSGRIVEIHSKLEPGEVIPRGETLFRIDPRNYRSALEQAEATVDRWTILIEQQKRQFAVDRDRLKTLNRNRELAEAEYRRLSSLFQESQVGAQSAVDAAERALNQAKDASDQLARQVDLYPMQIRESESQLRAAQAQAARAQADLERCAVEAPFNARVKSASIKEGQFVMHGSPVLNLADDSVLELHISIDSREARRWLLFQNEPGREEKSWFGGLAPVECLIRWTEAPEGHVWRGILDRVVRFDPETRTLTLAVRVTGPEARSMGKEGLPLVEGMFCLVEIPGRTMEGVFRLPRWAVSFEETVFLAVDGRLRTVPVTVERMEGRDVFVSGGVQPGDDVIVTRLVDPLENSLLDISRVTLEGAEE